MTRRLRAPAVDGGLLAQPPLERAAELLASNAAAIEAWSFEVLGRPIGELRRVAKAQARAAIGAYLGALGELGQVADLLSRAGLWIVTGHQPELFHPGVWVKNFATGALACARDGVGVHLIVDNDLPKGAVIRVPRLERGGLRMVSVAFDAASPDVPYEQWSIGDEGLFRGFGERVRGTLSGLVADPLIETYWPRVLDTSERPFRPGVRFAVARREQERAWGLRLLEVPLSRISQTEAFVRFAVHLMRDAGRFREIHNAALRTYREVNHVRSRTHPVPDLDAADGWVETPFWVWRADRPRRRPLQVQRAADRLRLRAAGTGDALGELTLEPSGDRAVAELLGMQEAGWCVRSRALTTTMYARLFLSELFVHGIGGAKYDELGDRISERFFGVRPPRYLVLSQTVWLGLVDFAHAESEARVLKQRQRELMFNPERSLLGRDEPQIRRWVEEKRRAIAGPQTTRAQRVARWCAIRACNLSLQPWMEAERRRGEERLRELSDQCRWNQVAHQRGWPFVLHSAARLRRTLGVVGRWEDCELRT